MAEINSLCKTLKFLKDICLLAEGRRSCASIIFYLIRRIEDHCAKQSQSQSTTPLCQDVNDTILRTLQKHKSEYLKSDMLLICTYLDPRFVDHPNILERTDWMRARQLLADMCEQRFNSSNSLPSAANFDGPVVVDDGEDDWNSWNRCSHDIQNSARSPIILSVLLFVIIVQVLDACFQPQCGGGGGGCGGGCGGGGGGCGGGCGGCGKRKRRSLDPFDENEVHNSTTACNSEKLKNLIQQSVIAGSPEMSVVSINQRLEDVADGHFVTWCEPRTDSFHFATTMVVYCSLGVGNVTCTVFNH
ncbi:hypothetical protein QR680_016305 [Steinernema hermaphroditum]|uniref:Ground-like domain-containing protein n=1 Tax=Steinernema hermaphroditum TaxID=289476 RepID=A0AA39HD99_9BILA|nr:hypothetical protein QR680_016305 [Steinernema hermaphroditum]